jgi:hypothetical protein
LVGTLSATDVDTDDDALTFTTNSADFEIANGNELKTKRVFETDGNKSVTITASDGTRSIDKNITVTVTDLDDEAPTNIQISDTDLPVDSPVGTLVGTLSATDVDTDDDSFY